VRLKQTTLLACLSLIGISLAVAQTKSMILPQTVTAGGELSIPTIGNGHAVLYIVGPGQALRRDVQVGEVASFPAGVLYNAGHYVAILVNGSSIETGEFDVTPSSRPESLGFLAKPSRLPVGVHNGISGAIYVFDAYRNLITTPMSASLELSSSSGVQQTRTMTTKNGVAWAEMDSATKEGAARFVARVGGISGTRVIEEVPGDPCRLTISARQNGAKLEIETAPVRDCSGNSIPDGTIISFTETFNGTQSTVDVPLKKGTARVDMPANKGAKISVASGVVAGNEIRWEGPR
jgi:hypothetical protein